MGTSANRWSTAARDGARRFGRSLAVRVLALGILLGTTLALPGRADSNVTQTFLLRPGWNAIYLEVQPEVSDPASVFAGLPVESVWTFARRVVAAEFIQHPGEGLFGQPGWLVFFPPSRPESFTSNLYDIQVNHPYLIKLEGSETASWTVNGRPSVRPLRWAPDALTLVGLPVDPAAPPTFAEFFSASPAHAGQPVFWLNGDVWEQIADPAATPVTAGESYWVFTAGGSDYQGPLALELPQGDGLNYGESILEQPLRVRKTSSGGAGVIFSLRDAAVPLSYQTLADVTFGSETARAITWLPLNATVALVREAAVGQSVVLNLAVRRAEFAGDAVASVLEVSDGAGVRWRVPVEAKRRAAAEVPVGGSAGLHAEAAPPAGATDLVGLWVGEAVLDAVSESNPNLGAPDPAAPTPTVGEFSVRLLLHVDTSGQAVLLKEVIQMWENGTLAPDPDNPEYQEVDRPGRRVLLTDDTRIPTFTGVTLRDGEWVGRRLSSAAFDFEDTTLPLDGTGFGVPGSALTGTIIDPAEGPTNPFRHGFHPDHDNLDAKFEAFAPEAYEVTRAIEFRFADRDPALANSSAGNPPEWGWELVGGLYRETVSGLHRNPIVVEGSFRLRRAAITGELDPEPLP